MTAIIRGRMLHEIMRSMTSRKTAVIPPFAAISRRRDPNVAMIPQTRHKRDDGRVSKRISLGDAR